MCLENISKRICTDLAIVHRIRNNIIVLRTDEDARVKFVMELLRRVPRKSLNQTEKMTVMYLYLPRIFEMTHNDPRWPDSAINLCSCAMPCNIKNRTNIMNMWNLGQSENSYSHNLLLICVCDYVPSSKFCFYLIYY